MTALFCQLQDMLFINIFFFDILQLLYGISLQQIMAPIRPGDVILEQNGKYVVLLDFCKLDHLTAIAN